MVGFVIEMFGTLYLRKYALYNKNNQNRQTWTLGTYSDLDSADFQSSKFIAKLSTDVATSALLNKIVIEV